MAPHILRTACRVYNSPYYMTNCPKCYKPLMSETILTTLDRIKLRCPWCQVHLEVHIQPKVRATVLDTDLARPFPLK